MSFLLFRGGAVQAGGADGDPPAVSEGQGGEECYGEAEEEAPSPHAQPTPG